MRAKITFAKVKPDAIIPSKREEDAGFDVYACFDEDYMVIFPHETKLIPTGIAGCCDKDYCFIAKERGSTGSKGMALRCGVLDSGYRNEWFIALTNTTEKMLFISKITDKLMYERFGDNILVYPYSKAIAQVLVVPVPETEVNVVSYEELKEIKSERGMGALGSSNK